MNNLLKVRSLEMGGGGGGVGEEGGGAIVLSILARNVVGDFACTFPIIHTCLLFCHADYAYAIHALFITCLCMLLHTA